MGSNAVSLEGAVSKSTQEMVGGFQRLQRGRYASAGTWRMNRSLPGGQAEVGSSEESQVLLLLQRFGGLKESGELGGLPGI